MKTGSLLLALSCLIPACAERMSLEQARQVAVTTTEKEPFTPPPRRIDDLLAMLETGGRPAKVNGNIEILSASPPPPSAAPARVMDFYMKRGIALFDVGRQNEALQDLRRAHEAAQKADIRNEMLLIRLAKIEREYGNFRRALTLVKEVQTFSSSLPVLDEIVKLYGAIGDLAGARNVYEKAAASIEHHRVQLPAEALFHFEDMRAVLSELEGDWKEAELHVRKAMGYLAKISQSTTLPRISHRLWLSKSLLEQERFLEAEFEIRKALKESLAHLGNTSIFTLRAIENLVDVTLAQGRVNEAERLARTQIRLLDVAAAPPDSLLFSRARMSLGNVLSAKREYMKSLEEFHAARLAREEFQEKRFSPKGLSMILALLMTGRTEEADRFIGPGLQLCRDRFGEGHFLTAELTALEGLARARRGREKEGFENLGKSLPVLIAGLSGEGRDFSKTERVKTILEEYLGLLSEIQGRGRGVEMGIEPVSEGFKIADALRSRSVQGALAASSARATATDPNLAELIRKEQDAQNQIGAIQAMLVDMLAAKEEEQIPQLIGELKTRMDILVQSRGVILDEIQHQFPKYSNFVNPEPPSPQEAVRLLRSGEALLSAYTAEEKTYIWLIEKAGPVRFAVSQLGRKDLHRLVTHLRKALDPKPQTLGDIPAFDLAQGYALYEGLLKPVEPGWKEAGDLIVVTGGPLGQIPLSVLPTSPTPLPAERGGLFSAYRRIPWLIRKIPVTTVPSVSSFVNLRSLPKPTPGRKPMAGFGDPFFSRIQASLAQGDKDGRLLASRGGIAVRGIRMAEGAELDVSGRESTRLESLSRLPDTAEELRGICEEVGGDAATDLFTGRSASEGRVKTMDLSDRRVIAFATHALVPGDLDGLDQPALALSAPSVTGDKEDGLLTMSEVLKLKLNADWVVLSACNTGAAEGDGAEAVSGLGRAFFYAGTRALLVSMWPVETTSARLLTTGLFRAQRENDRMSSSAALRKSILELIDHQVLKDPETGGVVATYAHPLFWAPFVVVGEAGGS